MAKLYSAAAPQSRAKPSPQVISLGFLGVGIEGTERCACSRITDATSAFAHDGRDVRAAGRTEVERPKTQRDDLR